MTREELDRTLVVAPIASVQIRLNAKERESEALLDHTAERGIAFILYGPLSARPMQQGARLDPAAALHWLLARSPNVIVIPGTTSISHLEENARALADA